MNGGLRDNVGVEPITEVNRIDIITASNTLVICPDETVVSVPWKHEVRQASRQLLPNPNGRL